MASQKGDTSASHLFGEASGEDPFSQLQHQNPAPAQKPVQGASNAPVSGQKVNEDVSCLFGNTGGNVDMFFSSTNATTNTTPVNQNLTSNASSASFFDQTQGSGSFFDNLGQQDKSAQSLQTSFSHPEQAALNPATSLTQAYDPNTYGAYDYSQQQQQYATAEQQYDQSQWIQFDPNVHYYYDEQGLVHYYDPNTNQEYDMSQYGYDQSAQTYDYQYDPQYAEYYAQQGYDPNAYAASTDTTQQQVYDPNAYSAGADTTQQQAYGPSTYTASADATQQQVYDPNAYAAATDVNQQQIYDPNAYAVGGNATQEQAYAPTEGSYDPNVYAATTDVSQNTQQKQSYAPNETSYNPEAFFGSHDTVQPPQPYTPANVSSNPNAYTPTITSSIAPTPTTLKAPPAATATSTAPPAAVSTSYDYNSYSSTTEVIDDLQKVPQSSYDPSAFVATTEVDCTQEQQGQYGPYTSTQNDYGQGGYTEDNKAKDPLAEAFLQTDSYDPYAYTAHDGSYSVGQEQHSNAPFGTQALSPPVAGPAQSSIVSSTEDDQRVPILHNVTESDPYNSSNVYYDHQSFATIDQSTKVTDEHKDIVKSESQSEQFTEVSSSAKDSEQHTTYDSNYFDLDVNNTTSSNAQASFDFEDQAFEPIQVASGTQPVLDQKQDGNIVDDLDDLILGGSGNEDSHEHSYGTQISVEQKTDEQNEISVPQEDTTFALEPIKDSPEVDTKPVTSTPPPRPSSVAKTAGSVRDQAPIDSSFLVFSREAENDTQVPHETTPELHDAFVQVLAPVESQEEKVEPVLTSYDSSVYSIQQESFEPIQTKDDSNVASIQTQEEEAKEVSNEHLSYDPNAYAVAAGDVDAQQKPFEPVLTSYDTTVYTAQQQSYEPVQTSYDLNAYTADKSAEFTEQDQASYKPNEASHKSQHASVAAGVGPTASNNYDPTVYDQNQSYEPTQTDDHSTAYEFTADAEEGPQAYVPVEAAYDYNAYAPTSQEGQTQSASQVSYGYEAYAPTAEANQVAQTTQADQTSYGYESYAPTTKADQTAQDNYGYEAYNPTTEADQTGKTAQTDYGYEAYAPTAEGDQTSYGYESYAPTTEVNGTTQTSYGYEPYTPAAEGEQTAQTSYGYESYTPAAETDQTAQADQTSYGYESYVPTAEKDRVDQTTQANQTSYGYESYAPTAEGDQTSYGYESYAPTTEVNGTTQTSYGYESYTPAAEGEQTAQTSYGYESYAPTAEADQASYAPTTHLGYGQVGTTSHETARSVGSTRRSLNEADRYYPQAIIERSATVPIMERTSSPRPQLVPCPDPQCEGENKPKAKFCCECGRALASLSRSTTPGFEGFRPMMPIISPADQARQASKESLKSFIEHSIVLHPDQDDDQKRQLALSFIDSRMYTLEESKALCWQVVKLMLEFPDQKLGEGGVLDQSIVQLIDTKEEVYDQSFLSQLEKLLIEGNREKACDYAIENGIWGHGLIIASSDPELFQKTVSKFIQIELFSSAVDRKPQLPEDKKALRMLYSVFNGAGANSVSEFVKNTFDDIPEYTESSLYGWRHALALILANRSKEDQKAISELGEKLNELQKKNDAQLCYLLSPDESSTRLSQKDLDELYLIELYEFACNAKLEQNYKLMMAWWLTEVGFTNESNLYCDSIVNSVSHESSLTILDQLKQVGNILNESENVTPVLTKENFDTLIGSIEEKLNTQASSDGYGYSNPTIGGFNNYGYGYTESAGENITSPFTQPYSNTSTGSPYVQHDSSKVASPFGHAYQASAATTSGWWDSNQVSQEEPIPEETADTPIQTSYRAYNDTPLDDEDDDLGFGNNTLKKKAIIKETESSNEDKITDSTTEEKPHEMDDDKTKAPETKEKSSGGWGLFSLFGRNKELSSDEKKAVKANLGEQSSFYYDEKEKRWVNKLNDSKPAAATPPPPPKSSTPSASTTPAIGTPPPMSTPPMSTPPMMSPSAGLKPNSMPPSRTSSAPTVGGPPSIAPPTFNTPPTSTRRAGGQRKPMRSRYVDILNPNQN